MDKYYWLKVVKVVELVQHVLSHKEIRDRFSLTMVEFVRPNLPKYDLYLLFNLQIVNAD